MNKQEKPVDKNKFHKEYLAWKRESKNGKKRYYLNNVLCAGFLCTALFTLLLWLVTNVFRSDLNFGWQHILIYTAVFLVVYTGLLFLIYALSWKHNEKKFASYEAALKELAKKRTGEQPDGDVPAAEQPAEETAEQPAEAVQEEKPEA